MMNSKILKVLLFVLLSLPLPAISAEEIKLDKVGGVYELPVQLNDVLTLNFILDTGASDVSLSEEILLTLIRSGTISKKDILGKANVIIADGSKIQTVKFLIRKIKVGNQIVQNVNASVTPSLSPLLLGQSFLEKLGTWSLDHKRKLLIINSSPETIDNTSSQNICSFRMEQFFNGITAQKANSVWNCREGGSQYQFQIFSDGTGISSIVGPFIWQKTDCQTVIFKSRSGLGKASEINGDVNYGIITFKDSFGTQVNSAVCLANTLN